MGDDDFGPLYQQLFANLYQHYHDRANGLPALLQSLHEHGQELGRQQAYDELTVPIEHNPFPNGDPWVRGGQLPISADDPSVAWVPTDRDPFNGRDPFAGQKIEYGQGPTIGQQQTLATPQQTPALRQDQWSGPKMEYGQGPTIGQVDEPPYYAEGASDVSNQIANREAQRLYAHRTAGRTPEDIETARNRAAAVGMFASPEAQLLLAGREGLDTGDYSGVVMPAAQIAAGPVLGAAMKYAPGATKAALSAISSLAPAATESAAADNPQAAVKANEEAATQPPKIQPMSPDEVQKAIASDRAALEAQRAALTRPTEPPATDYSKFAGRGMYGARAAQRADDAKKAAQYQSELSGYNSKVDAINQAINGLADKYAPNAKAWEGLPLVEKHPLVAATMMYGGTALEAFLAPYLTRFASGRMNAAEMQRWAEALDAANAAMSKTTKSGAMASLAARVNQAKPNMGTLEQFAAKPPGSGVVPGTIKAVTGGVIPAGMFMGAMASPQEYDRFFTDPDSEARRQAEHDLSDPSFWLTRAAFGAVPLGFGSSLGWKLPAFETKPPIASTKGAMSTFDTLMGDLAKQTRAKNRGKGAKP